MEQYYKEENGIKIWLGKVLKVNGLQIFNPSKEQILAAGYIEYVADGKELSEQNILDNLKNGVKAQILAYDASVNVNVCYIQNNGIKMEYWADKHERDALKSALRDCIAMGRTEYRLDLRELGISLKVPCETMLKILAALEVYAVDCYNMTTNHIFSVKNLKTKDDVLAYDYKSGYPDKLIFSLDDGNKEESEENDIE